MTGDASKQGWREEFKKLTAPTAGGTGVRPPGAERRRHPRFSLHDATVKLYRRGATALFGLAGLNIEGMVVDLSEGGLRLESGEKFLVDTRLRLKVLVAKFNDTLEADGITRWCHGDPKNPERFQVGVQFQGLDAATARKIDQMRGWYTSPQYKALRDQGLKEKNRP